jgi:hypothetical protein
MDIRPAFRMNGPTGMDKHSIEPSHQRFDGRFTADGADSAQRPRDHAFHETASHQVEQQTPDAVHQMNDP